MQQSCDCFTQQSRDCFTHDVRLFDALELRLFYATELRVFDAWCPIVLCTMCECFMHDVRLFMRRGRGGAKGRGVMTDGWLLIVDEKNGEKFGGVGNND